MRKGSVTIRPIQSTDRQLLLKWLTTADVLAFYEGRDQSFTLEKIEKKFFNEKERDRWIGEVDGASMAYLQSYRLTTNEKKKYGYPPSKTAMGMDLFIGEVSFWNKGYGTTLVNMLTENIIGEDPKTIVTVDPRVENERAIACYKKCGFTIVKRLEKNEWHEGKWHDAYIMQKS
ncbi:GNAT family N-acetyltransferase [Bacillus sp. Marseille-P3800]|uniref:GNAT family N-acetyltransferase n=2 Tax=Bacillaceae TaxID=186817 RepID=UPI00159BDAAC|nr:GNAT family N-acetyltransferase [Bacillus sp. Marseille-P3800]